nr:MAG TPA: hypothetical protein [Caudoviricetes sp.]
MAEPKLPAGYIYGLVVAKAIRAVGDMTDQDDPYPDGPPIELAQAVTFTPVEVGRIIKENPPNPSIRVIQERIVADFDHEGYLSINGQRGAWLYTGVWDVSFDGSLGWPSFQIEVKTDHTKDNPLDLWKVGYQPPSVTTPVTNLLIPASVNDGDILIWKGDHADGMPPSKLIRLSPYFRKGRGRPDKPETLDAEDRAWAYNAPVAAVWHSVDGGNVGAWLWRRASGRWIVVDGDTEVNKTTDNPDFINAFSSDDGTFIMQPGGWGVQYRRIGSMVEIYAHIKHVGTKESVSKSSLPVGWRPATNKGFIALNGDVRMFRLFVQQTGPIIAQGPDVNNAAVLLQYTTDDPWPDHL